LFDIDQGDWAKNRAARNLASKRAFSAYARRSGNRGGAVVMMTFRMLVATTTMTGATSKDTAFMDSNAGVLGLLRRGYDPGRAHIFN